MTKLLLSVHVLAAILAIGPIAVAASVFPHHVGTESAQDGRVALLLYRICRGYTVVGIAVPVFGLATGAKLGVLGDTWLIASIVLTVLAAGVLILGILPGQRRLLPPVVRHMAGDEAAHEPGEGVRAAAGRLTMLTGIFNVLWAIVVVLMIVRPGSTTGA